MQDLIIGIGKKLKQSRKSKNMTLTELAGKADISPAMISKVENGRTVPSLPVLLTLLKSLQEEPGNFFRGINLNRDKPYLVMRHQDLGELEEGNDTQGCKYQLILDKWLFSVGFEVVLLSVQPGVQREKIQTEAYEFKYMLSGSCVYQLDNEEIELNAGDAIYFDGRIPHNPDNRQDTVAQILVIYFYME